jgi:hypothetical protein
LRREHRFHELNHFLCEPALSPYRDGKTWWLDRALVYEGTETVRVPEGFATDFASIPRLFWILLPTWGTYGPAAIVHDWLYWTQRCTRQSADDTLLEAMVALGVSGWQMAAIYKAVHLFGGLAWRDNARLVSEGYSRMHSDGATRPGWKRRLIASTLLLAGTGADA